MQKDKEEILKILEDKLKKVKDPSIKKSIESKIREIKNGEVKK